MAGRKTVGLKYALDKIKDLEAEFGFDSDVVIHARSAVEGKMSFLDEKYQDDDGNWNVNAIKNRYKQINNLITQLEETKNDTHLPDVERQKASDQLGPYKEERRNLKGILNVGGAEINQAIQTVPQMYGEQWKYMRSKDFDKSDLDEVEQAIIGQTTRKGLLNLMEQRADVKQYMMQRVEHNALMAENWVRLKDDLYDIYLDDTQDQSVRDDAYSIWQNRNYSANWMAEAEAFIKEHLGEQMYMDRNAFYN